MVQEETTLKVAAVQLSPVLFNRDGTTEKVIKAIEKCGQEGIRLAVFPETFIPNYPYFSWLNPPATIAEMHGKLYDQAVDVPGPITDSVGTAAKKAGNKNYTQQKLADSNHFFDNQEDALIEAVAGWLEKLPAN